MSKHKHTLFAMENPLLDISAHVDHEMVNRYECVFGNAILAEEKHMPVYEELVNNYKPQFIAGGSTQNTARVFVWMLQEKESVVYCGSVGNDKYAEFMKGEAEKCGVVVNYHVDEKPTGTCAVLIVGKERSLIANLSAANNYKYESFLSEKTQSYLRDSKYIYSGGYFLTVSVESMIGMGKHAAQENKVFMTNLAATFIPQFYKSQFLEVLVYADYVFGNADEVESLSKSMEYHTDIEDVAKKISLYEKVNTKRDRVVVFTQGAGDIIVAIKGEIQRFKVPHVEKEKIVDMNGAGDAFCGGFISQLVLEKSLDVCIQAGNYAAQVIMQRDGCTFPEKPEFIEKN